MMHLGKDWYKKLLETIQQGRDLVIIRIPELNFGSDLNFFDVVKDMGVRKIFSSESELTEISESQVSITKYVQSSVFKLDEDGVSGSSSSSAVGGVGSSLRREFFYLDEPFYFFITENSTGAILFLGKVSQL